ncbi:response regulator transcription factor [Microbacterium sp. R86528]|uniref:response regulator transcription factor n=1 Tax=Microbacterium sp. R86528 TaxID=3093864 RepID=UPI0037C7487A
MNLNDPDTAREELDRAVDSGNPESIAQIAMFHVWPLLNSHTEALIAAVSDLDPPVLERYPALRIVHPMTAAIARTSRSAKPLLHSDNGRKMSPEEIDFVLLTQMIAFRVSGELEPALTFAKRLNDRITQTRVESRDRLDGPLWFFRLQIGATLLAAGDTSNALLEFATARQLGKLSAQQDAERTAVGRVALAHAVRGALGDAQRALDRARELPAPSYAHATASITTERAAAALIAADQLSADLDEQLSLLEPYDANDLIWPFALLARCRALLARDQPEHALEALRLARGSHPVHPGSFAFDVISAASIKTLCITGDLTAARRLADEARGAGILTSIASVHLLLRENRFDTAADELRLLTKNPTLGPAPRAECALLGGWLELARTEEVSIDTALRVFRLVRNPDNARLLTTLPRQLVEAVHARLPAELANELESMTEGRSYFEMQIRPTLTQGELRVLNALVTHSSTAEIASSFFVSPNTIKSQLRSLYRKLDCSTREEAISAGARLRFLSPTG